MIFSKFSNKTLLLMSKFGAKIEKKEHISNLYIY